MRLILLSILAAMVLIAGCATTIDTTPTGEENFKLYVSDAPADIGDFESLMITFEQARIFQINESWEMINFSEEVDLTGLVGAEVEELAMAYLPPGEYEKIELHVTSITGMVAGEEVDVKVPSEKLQITKPFAVTNDSVTEFVFDINVVKKGNGGYNLLPNIAKSGLKEEHDAAEAAEVREENAEGADDQGAQNSGQTGSEDEEDLGSDVENESSNTSAEGGEGQLDLQVSDAPAAIEDFSYLNVHLYEARIFPDGEQWQVYDLDETLDLTQLVGEASESVLKTNLSSGTYTKVELKVDEVWGNVNGTNVSIKLPSDKLQITMPFAIIAGEETTFVFDIQVVRKGNGGYNLLPNIAESGAKVGDNESGEDEELCLEDADCADLEICLDGECEAVACINDSDCAENETCMNYECELLDYECVQDEDCEGLALCVDNVCEAVECIESADCAENETCEDFVCELVPECVLDEDCEAGEVCSENTCIVEIVDGNETNGTDNESNATA